MASACKEIYAPPTASLSLRGFVVGGTFLRGVLDKVGLLITDEGLVERVWWVGRVLGEVGELDET